MSVYLSREDSALLRKVLEGYTGERCLELGAGNGGTLVELQKRFRTAVGTDIVRPGMRDWSAAKADFVLADVAGCMRSSTFDLVAFNPPYLVGGVDDPAVDAGDDMGVPLRFLADALRVVKESGTVVMLLNDAADLEPFRGLCSKSGFVLERVARERLFFEELSVYAARRKRGKSPLSPS